MDDATLSELQSWTGKSLSLQSDLPIFTAQALAGAINSREMPAIGSPLPLLWHWLYFLEPTSRDRTGEDGHPLKGGFLPPVPLPRRMWAAGSMDVKHPLVVGDVTNKVSTISAVETKEGRSGPLVFVNLRHEFSQGGVLCIHEEQNLVYREAPAERTSLPPGDTVTIDADFSRSLTADPVLLFRYSALTYNAHRIHYDRNYAVNSELYPALVVHGPLLATLLLQLAAENVRNARFSEFKFRAVRPIFDNQPFTLCGRCRDDRLDLWCADQNGYVCMKAEAALS
ncbi:MAG: MaoC family dehydratase N-terminal domain-containing protein [Pseudomonadota bacterium]